MLWNHLVDEMHGLSHVREADVAASLQSVDALNARKTRIQQQYGELLGWLPEKTPLNAQVTGTVYVPGENYYVEKVVYESRPNHHVTANLYLPVGAQGPVPGVLIACGHSEEGKAYEAYAKAAALTVGR